MRNLRPDFIITLVWAIGSGALLLLMGMEVIHNQKVVDRLLVTIPTTGAIIAGYWFSKGKNNGAPS
jgi:hypothetical protein